MNYDGILEAIITTNHMKMADDARARVRSIEFIYIMNFRRSMLAVAFCHRRCHTSDRLYLLGGLWKVFSGAIKFNEIIFGVRWCACANLGIVLWSQIEIDFDGAQRTHSFFSPTKICCFVYLFIFVWLFCREEEGRG